MKGRIKGLSYCHTKGLVAIGSFDCSVTLIDVKKKEILHRYDQLHTGKIFSCSEYNTLDNKANVNAVEISRDGIHLITGSFDQNIKIIDLRTGEIKHTFYKLTMVSYFATLLLSTVLADKINSISLNPRGNLIVSGSNDKTVKVLELKKLRCLSTFKTLHRGKAFPKK